MKKILIITNIQFGYLTDILKYCEYLDHMYEIQIISVDDGFTKVEGENIEVHYVKEKNKFLKRIKFLKISTKVSEALKPDIIFIDYFIGCSLVKFLLGNKYVYNLDIRTGAISRNKRIRKIKNIILKLECYSFENVTIVSQSLQKHIHIDNRRIHILPLGADNNFKGKTTTLKNENRKEINLVYVGTFYERNIHQTILGIRIFMNKYRNLNFHINYDIIGFSKNITDEKKIEATINEMNLNGIVKFHGKLQYKDALEFISKAQVGVSYIPITEYFNFQPPTKTFEYLLSGIPCIATKTFENSQIINKTNGILINDTPESFCEGLYNILKNIDNYQSEEIVNSVSKYTWKNIIFDNLNPYLNGINK